MPATGSDPSFEARLARLEARAGLEDLIADLGRAFDNGPDAAALAAVFTADARFEVDRYGTFEGRDAIVAGVVSNADTGFSWTLHFLVSPRPCIAADCRSARTDFLLWETATAASGRDYWIGGRYSADAVHDADAGWRFSRLTLDAQLISHYREGWHDKPHDLGDA